MAEKWQLGIESSVPVASVVLLRDGVPECERVVEADRNHSAVLIEPLAEVLSALPAGVALGEVVVATGPGSYNGARVGMAAGQGVALIHGCPAVGVPSLEALATVREGGPCLAVGDARRGSFFSISIKDGRLTGPPDFHSHEEFLARLKSAGDRGEWVFTLEDPERLGLPDSGLPPVELARPTARLAIAAWEARTEIEREALRQTPLQPFYLRPPHITAPKER